MGEELNNVNVKEENSQIESEETVEIVEISASEPIAIDSQEAFPALGEDNEKLNHAILYGRDTLDQHPITSITGLRKELNVIESLQTIYSDKKQQANYYMWQDENPLQENCEGYFVSICLETDKIEKCNGQTDVFGVTVAEAGFIGNQAYEESNNEDEVIIKVKKDRDNKYGLVVTTGIVGVRCESDVTAGDYVVSNQDGIAKKVNDNCGYLVTAISNDNGVQYAMISLSTPSTWTQSLTNEVQGLDKRVKNAEHNIVSATNIANSAYEIAKNVADVDIENIKNKVNEALNEVNENTDIVGNLSNLVNNASKTAVQAKAIAESAVNSAEIIRSEAVDLANNALTTALQAQDEIEKVRDSASTGIENALLEAEKAQEDIAKLSEDITPLSQWTSSDGTQSGISGFVSQSDSESTQLALISEWKSDVESDVDSIAAIKMQSNENKSSIDSLTSWKGTTSETLTSIQQQVDENSSNISLITSWKDTVNTSVANIGAVADANKASIDSITKWQNDTSTALSAVEQKASDNESQINVLTSWQSDANDSIAAIQTTANDNKAAIEGLTSWQGETNNSIANIQQQADDDGAIIQALVANIDKYSVGEYSQAYGLTLEQAQSILKSDTLYIPTVDHNESDSIPILGNGIDGTEKFLKGYAYTWTDEGWSVSKAQSVAFSGEYVAGGAANPYWVVVNQGVVEDGITYDLGGLYKWENDAWIKVASVLDNSISRAVSSIRQKANEIEAEVVSARGDAASLNLRIQNNETTVQTLASWKDDVSDDISKIATIEQKANDNSASIGLVVAEKNGEKVIDAASIVMAINDSGDSSAVIQAKKIDLKGAVTADSIASGMFTTTQEVYLPPTYAEVNAVKNHINGTTILSDISLYDIDGSGTLDSIDLSWFEKNSMSTTFFSQSSMAKLFPNKKSTVTVTISVKDPEKIIHIEGTNLWGSSISKEVGVLTPFLEPPLQYNDPVGQFSQDIDNTLGCSSKFGALSFFTELWLNPNGLNRYATCSTASDVVKKQLGNDNVFCEITGTFDDPNTWWNYSAEPIIGTVLTVKFTNSNSASSPTLATSEDGVVSYPIRWCGVTLPESQYWGAGAIVQFVFTGSAWEIVGLINANGTTITVDDALSSTSTNPVQNKVVYEELEKKAKFKKYTRIFAKSDWTKLTEEPLYMVQITKSEHSLENPVVANALLSYTWIDEDGVTQENVQSSIDIGDRILSTGTVKLYVNYDISQYEKYDLKIILQGD